MSEKKGNCQYVDLSTRKNRLLKNVCRCGVTLALAAITTKGMEKGVQYAGDTLGGIKTEITEGRADNGHWVEFVEVKAEKPLKTLGDALKTVGAFGIAGLAGWRLVPKKRRETMSADMQALYAAAKRNFNEA